MIKNQFRPTSLISIIFFLGSLFYSATLYAAPIPDIATMVKNLSETVPNFMQFVTAFAYVMGMIMIIQGVLKLKQYGESRTMMSSQHELKGPIIYLLVGAALLYLPSSVQVGLTTFWTEPTPYAYVTDAQDPWTKMLQSIFMIIQLIGVIAFIRGLMLLTHLGGQGGAQHGTFGRAMAHMVAGILCINIYQFINAVLATFGIGQLTF